MATTNPAHDRHHVREAYRSRLAATRRRDRLATAGYRAYLVDMAGTLPASRRYAIHISEGKRADLRGPPTGKRT